MVLGHSERRTLFHETSALVAQKTKASIDTGLNVILCIGETLDQREAGTTIKVVEEQREKVREGAGSVVRSLNDLLAKRNDSRDRVA